MSLREEVAETVKALESKDPTEQQKAAAINRFLEPEKIDNYLRGAGVRKRLRQESEVTDQMLIPEECHAWLLRCRLGGSMVLCGPPGSGKSTAAVWCLRRLYTETELRIDDLLKPRWNAPVAHYAKAGELYDAVFDKDDEKIARAERADVLVLDDWGQQYEHAWPLSRMDRLIDRRWDDGLPTIVTTNTQPVDIEATLPRAFDRLTGWPGPGVVELNRPSLRRRG